MWFDIDLGSLYHSCDEEDMELGVIGYLRIVMPEWFSIDRDMLIDIYNFLTISIPSDDE